MNADFPRILTLLRKEKGISQKEASSQLGSSLDSLKGKEGVYVFHAGTKLDDAGRFVTNGGRVLGVTATGPDLKAARANAYEAVKQVTFEKAYCRSDIGKAIDEA